MLCGMKDTIPTSWSEPYLHKCMVEGIYCLGALRLYYGLMRKYAKGIVLTRNLSFLQQIN